MFSYCTGELGYAEAAAYKRIQTARVAQACPETLGLLESGRLHMSAVVALAPHLKDGRARELLLKACGRSKREVEALAASLAPGRQRPDRVVRFQVSAPQPEAGASPPAELFPAQREASAGQDRCAQRLSDGPEQETSSPPGAAVETLPLPRARISFDCGEEFLQDLERARGLLRHKFPAGEYESVFGLALKTLLEARDPSRRRGKRRRPAKSSTPGSRRVPAWVREEVWRRDGGRCVFVGEGGRKCAERSGLEFDHITPFALGGRSDDPADVRLLCKTHNGLAAERAFGKALMRERAKRGKRKP